MSFTLNIANLSSLTRLGLKHQGCLLRTKLYRELCDKLDARGLSRFPMTRDLFCHPRLRHLAGGANKITIPGANFAAYTAAGASCLFPGSRSRCYHKRSETGETATVIENDGLDCSSPAITQSTDPQTRANSNDEVDDALLSPEDRSQQICLLDQNGQLLRHTTKLQAIRESRKTNLKLVKILPILVDANVQTGGLPIYQFMTGKQLADERERLKAAKKAVGSHKHVYKQLRISGNIQKHDLAAKTGNLVNWLEKDYVIKTAVECPERQTWKRQMVLSEIFRLIEGHGEIKDLNESNRLTRFEIHPIKPSKADESGES